MSETNKQLVLQIEDAYGRDDLDALDAFFAEDFVSYAGAPGLPPGLAGGKLAHQGSKHSFPDRAVTVEDVIAEGDKVVIRCRMTGTNTGGLDWVGIPANGRRVDVEWISIYTCRDGKVTEHRAVMDFAGVMQQLTAPEAAGAARE